MHAHTCFLTDGQNRSSIRGDLPGGDAFGAEKAFAGRPAPSRNAQDQMQGELSSTIAKAWRATVCVGHKPELGTTLDVARGAVCQLPGDAR